jgi:hypothetical protein
MKITRISSHRSTVVRDCDARVAVRVTLAFCRQRHPYISISKIYKSYFFSFTNNTGVLFVCMSVRYKGSFEPH